MYDKSHISDRAKASLFEIVVAVFDPHVLTPQPKEIIYLIERNHR